MPTLEITSIHAKNNTKKTRRKGPPPSHTNIGELQYLCTSMRDETKTRTDQERGTKKAQTLTTPTRTLLGEPWRPTWPTPLRQETASCPRGVSTPARQSRPPAAEGSKPPASPGKTKKKKPGTTTTTKTKTKHGAKIKDFGSNGAATAERRR